jgi:hypothetical protein
MPCPGARPAQWRCANDAPTTRKMAEDRASDLHGYKIELIQRM